MSDDMRRPGGPDGAGSPDGAGATGSEISLCVSGYPGAVRFSRARDYHLYTPEGRRYLDCILAGGAAVLGHTPPGLSQALKNRISAGPLVPAEGKDGGRLRLAVRRLFPGVKRVRPIPLGTLSGDDLADLPLWRPFETAPPDSGATPEPPAGPFLLVPSFPLDPGLLIYCSFDSGEAAARPGARAPSNEAHQAARAAAAPAPNPAGVEGAGLTAAATGRAAVAAALGDGSGHPLLGAPPLSPVMVAGLTKAVHLLASAYEGQPLPRKLATSESDGWKEPLTTGDLWEARGIYYRYVGPEKGYEELQKRLEEAGILIPTSAELPLVVPRILGGHERSLWDRIHATF